MSQKNTQSANEEKLKRVAVGMTVAGVLLVLFLLIILIIQFVQIGVARAQTREYEKQEELYKTENEKLEKTIDYYITEEGMYWLAIHQGYTSPR